MTAPKPPRLVALRCASCQAPLTGKSSCCLFLCPRCPSAIEIGSDGVHPYPVLFGKPPVERSYRPSWLLDVKIHVTRFAATEGAKTVIGTLPTGGATTLATRLIVPAWDQSASSAYREAIDRAGTTLVEAHRKPDLASDGGAWSRAEAERIARQVFLTLVARAPGKVHRLDFTIDVDHCRVFAE